MIFKNQWFCLPRQNSPGSNHPPVKTQVYSGGGVMKRLKLCQFYLEGKCDKGDVWDSTSPRPPLKPVLTHDGETLHGGRRSAAIKTSN